MKVDSGGLVLDQLWNRQGLSGSTHPPFEGGGLVLSSDVDRGGGLQLDRARELD